ncbi:hypothetical protein QVD17_07175 [Tagetes erecta]|uniref:Uncharacterized protein n=1 Tax=Tagetes erecta TaxID=13708 RepID=A0AAD8LHC2_TARER|nr:hypothetical protein QVD17_07175 [Tagetes erecta]
MQLGGRLLTLIWLKLWRIGLMWIRQGFFDKNPNLDENSNLANVDTKCAANVSEKCSNVVITSIDVVNDEKSSKVELNSEGQVSSSYADMVQKSSSELDASGTKLDQAQRLIDADPMNEDLRARESMLLASFQNASLDEERFLKQKSKVQWLAEGDANTRGDLSSAKVIMNSLKKFTGLSGLVPSNQKSTIFSVMCLRLLRLVF